VSRPTLYHTDLDLPVTINGIRSRIDAIDAQVIRLLKERAAATHQEGSVRVASGGTRLVLARDNEILRRYRRALGPDGARLGLVLIRAGWLPHPAGSKGSPPTRETGSDPAAGSST
jgi:chorismate mutase